MSDVNEYKEVYFHEYCESCKHTDVKNHEEPCNECLSNPTNLYSHKPVNYEKAAKKKKKE
jgi:hypothetical protein